jgi:hypothetical protein
MANDDYEDVIDDEEEEMTDMEILVHEVKGIRTIMVFYLLLTIFSILLWVFIAFQIADLL